MKSRAFAFIGASGSGKTTLIIRLIEELTARGFRVGAVKHTHCEFEIDYARKDSYRMTEAGAESVVVSSKRKLALVSETHKESSLKEILNEYFGNFDVVLAEGFHESEVPKILVESRDFQYPFHPERIQGQLIAAVTDGKESRKEFSLVTLFSRDQVELLADHLVADLPLVLSPAGNPLKCSTGP